MIFYKEEIPESCLLHNKFTIFCVWMKGGAGEQSQKN